MRGRSLRVMLLLLLTQGLLPTGRAQAADLLANPGFEEPYGAGGPATNWWYYGAAGRETWAHRASSLWGNTFYPAGNVCGGFGQDLTVDTGKGSVFRFSISGKAEQNYSNENTSIGMEFWSGGALQYAITQMVYSALSYCRGDWVCVTLVHTNTTGVLDTVKVRCDFADGTITSGAPLATCQWDDGRFYQAAARSESAPAMAKYEPVSGVYLGVLLERGGTAAQIQELNQKANKRHAVYARFLLFDQDPFPWEWVDMIQSNCPGAGIHFILEPMVGFTNFYAPDWGPGQGTYDAALSFVTNCAAADAPVFLRFAHEANGDWYPWHPEFSVRYGIPDTVSNETYIAGYRNFADLAHANASNVVMVWAPNQGNGPDPMPYYEDVYPGDEYVDWVGLSVYNGWSYGNSNEVLDYQFRNAIQHGYWQENDDPYDDTLEDFYWTFSDPDNPVGHHKPMMIAETAAAFEPKYDVSNEVVIAGFESLDGPQYTASNLLCRFQDLNSDGLVASNHTWVDGFDDLTTWNWGPWGTNGCTWSNTADAVEGTNALVMSGSPEAGGVHVGGNGRAIRSIPFYPSKTIAEFQALYTNVPYKEQDWWPAGPDCAPWGDGSDTYGGTHTWTIVSDPYSTYPTNALRMCGTDCNTNNYVGGNGFFTRLEDRDWDLGTHIALLVRHAGDAERADPLVRLELTDGQARAASVSEVVSAATYSRLLVARSNMTVDTGFTWTNVEQVKLHMLTGTAGEDPNDIYLKGFELGTVSNTTPADWSACNGLEIWVKRADDTNVCPMLSISIRSVTTDTNYVAEIQEVVTGTEWYPVRAWFDDMDVTPGFQWTNITALLLGLLSEQSNAAPSPLYVDRWNLVNLADAPYRDQDWWPPGTNDDCWADDTDAGGGWMTWEIVEDPMDGYPSNALRMSGFDANTNYYIGGNGFSLREADQDWSRVTYLSLVARRGDFTNAEPLLSISLRDSSNVRTAQASVVVVPTNYLNLHVPFAEMTVDDGFDWTNVSAVVFELLSGRPGEPCSDVFLKEFSIGTASNVTEQDWWTAGTGFQPWGDSTWTQSGDAAAGQWALQVSGVVTSDTQWYIGGNGCAMPVPQQDWSASGGLVLYAKQGTETNKVQPKFKITLDNDYAETNGNEAVVETKVANTNWYEMIVAFEDFIADAGFAWTNIRMVKIELFTGEAGKQPNDLFLDHLQLASITLTNGADNFKWKHDWCDQLYALENFEDLDPADPDEYPDCVSIFEHFRNLHMINWFHVKKFEDGFTKDLRIAEDGTNGVVYGSYYERIKDPYFLTNIVTDTDGDGMSDDWELAFFGGITNADATADGDGDGMSNYEEFFAGSDPEVIGSVFELEAGSVTQAAGDTVVIQWQSTSNRLYKLDRTTNLLSGFSLRAGGLLATPPLNTYTDAVGGAGPYFYRVRIQP